jgi:hypothetical protein
MKEEAMEISRRPVMQGLVASGVLASSARIGDARAEGDGDRPRADAGRSIAAILSGGPFDGLFLAGLQAAVPPHARIESLDLDPRGSADDLGRLQAALAPGRHARLVGLVDDGGGAVIVELARANGARMVWLGHHVTSAGHDETRHRILTADVARGCGILLGEHLRTCGGTFRLIEHHPGSKRGELVAVAAAPAAGSASRWATTLGILLGTLDDRGEAVRLRPLQPAAVPPLVAVPRPPRTFVSFAFEI